MPVVIDGDSASVPSGLDGNVLSETRQALQDLTGARTHGVLSRTDSYLQAQCVFLQQRLPHSETQLAGAKERAHQVETKCEILAAQALHDREQIDSLRAAGTARTAQLA